MLVEGSELTPAVTSRAAASTTLSAAAHYSTATASNRLLRRRCHPEKRDGQDRQGLTPSKPRRRAVRVITERADEGRIEQGKIVAGFCETVCLRPGEKCQRVLDAPFEHFIG